MGKLGIFSSEEVCDILRRHGFEEIRRRGSHIIMQQHTPIRVRTVPVPCHKQIKIGTLQSIIRQSGIGRTEFEK
ncbi:MAG: type II toxin-antitoxin system HicA family toxin [Candidatus Hydrogenedentes bacterium]|nr:type II toxin-antitoxin system HicA family toxin [Candidatus Hydrogenedentota bacterium]